ncbi:hypothetical protein [Actinokineospora sp. NBRC 105648]|nr:hypothetical protein [Actinokineospora sp. NBRC 105648]GLZ38348.1 hypothetical protein Acsp05_19720 [Actinokineospora sp. NBRC 105648]
MSLSVPKPTSGTAGHGARFEAAFGVAVTSVQAVTDGVQWAMP